MLSSAHAQTTEHIRFSAQASTPVLSVSQPLQTRLRITNRSQTSRYVFRDLEYFVTAWAYDGAARSMHKEVVEEVSPPPPLRSDFILLKPGQYIEYIRRERLGDLGIHKAGQYRIDFDYRMDLSPKGTYGLPVWRGTQRASVFIQVRAD